MSAILMNRQSSVEQQRRRHRSLRRHRRTPSNEECINEENSSRESSRPQTPTQVGHRQNPPGSFESNKSAKDPVRITIPEETSSELRDREEDGEDKYVRTTKQQPKTLWGRIKSGYDIAGGKHWSPVVILVLYSLIGAALFHLIEYDLEQHLISFDKWSIENKTNELLLDINTIFQTQHRRNDRENLEAGRQNITRIVTNFVLEMYQPFDPPIKWDIWGALFFVGTIYTTIGYGNIYPRTTGGQALAMVYAIIGIPLVLAILNDVGKLLCKYSNIMWKKISRKHKSFQLRRKITTRTTVSIANAMMAPSGLGVRHSMVSSSLMSSVFDTDSETMPVLLAIFLCVSWILLCAGLFMFWEDWTYFQSVYFFFISLSTIGLGDIVPAKPRMMIVNFWLVIVGLSLVSMTINVIQEKIEQWLFEMMQRIQDEYQRALEMGDCPEKDAILAKLMKDQPWYLRKLMPALIGEKAKEQLEAECEHQEKVNVQLSGTNSKSVQADIKDIETNVANIQTEVISKESAENQTNIVPDSDTISMQTSMVDTVDHGMQSSLHNDNEVELCDTTPLLQAVSTPVKSMERGIQYDTGKWCNTAECQTEFTEEPQIEHEILRELEEKLTQTSFHQDDMEIIKLLEEKLIQTSFYDMDEKNIQTSPWIDFCQENGVQTSFIQPDLIDFDEKLTQTSPNASLHEMCMQTSFLNDEIPLEQKLTQTSPNESMEELSSQTIHTGSIYPPLMDMQSCWTQTSTLPFSDAQTSPTTSMSLADSLTQTSPQTSFITDSTCQASIDQTHNTVQVGCSSWDRPNKECQTPRFSPEKPSSRDDGVQTQECFIFNLPPKIPKPPKSDDILDGGLSDSCSQTDVEENFDYISSEVQTEDSYLKIAHRLEALRFNRSKSLAIMAAKKKEENPNSKPKQSKPSTPANSNGHSIPSPSRNMTPSKTIHHQTAVDETDEDYSSSSDLLSSSSIGKGPKNTRMTSSMISKNKPFPESTPRRPSWGISRRESDPSVGQKKVSQMRMQYEKV